MNNKKYFVSLITFELFILLILLGFAVYKFVDPFINISDQLAQIGIVLPEKESSVGLEALDEGTITNGQPTPPSSQEIIKLLPVKILCAGYGDDRDYLYDLITDISIGPNGAKTFTLTRPGDNQVLRKSFPDEKFFTDKTNGKLDITYDIVSQCGGVDVVYTVKNLSTQTRSLPDFQIDGIMQKTTGNFFIVDTKDSGYIRNVGSSSGSPPNMLYGGGGVTYPNFYYIPGMIASDNNFAVGSALLYPYLQYKHSIAPQLTKVTKGPQTGTWRHEYRDFRLERFVPGVNPPNAQIASGEQRTYTVTLRFSPARNWILTLDPYKKFFKQTYGEVDQVRPKDLDPVAAHVVANVDSYNATTSPQSYVSEHLLTEGWGPLVDALVDIDHVRGFKRLMMWAPSGLYAPDSPCARGCNYPMHFMDFLPHLAETAGEFAKFAQNNIELGFWWGNSAYVPVPDRWAPDSKILANYSNPDHVSFLNDQLSLAYTRGAKIIGLDAFDGLVSDKYLRIDELKRLTNNQVLFVHENSGPDILHRKIANFYSPTAYDWWPQYDKASVAGPDVLSDYINKGAEVWLFQDVQPPFCNQTLYEKAYSWGFTSVMGSCPEIDLTSYDFTLVKCFDGKDNDLNGKIDWPYDLGCSSALDDQEVSSGVLEP